ncbi:twin-arginine translocase subunit TatC [Streptacidiphilus sp. ASG 303]|uniref:twin-arginine translocase subunit TatC n=1 Tax=Streptacidiphilus sp. ASG 303 TaxID=2896847 RepID=UPI001E6216C7|nr:twin-arginine translocase subunit TatC [Streptacidiphilus sp. ASG 303]MCD0486387.1 twin-arginine translocase subunit TatC [Streptacidiphilus sp. ASG 303]
MTSPPTTAESQPAGHMPLADHLRELRSRLTRAVGAIVVTTLVAGLFYKQLIGIAIAPLPGCAPSPGSAGDCGLIAVNGLLSPFTLAMKVSLAAGVLAASPVWLYQLWAFLAPGLHRHEKKYTVAFLATGIPLFLIGAAFAYAVLPTTARVLLSFTPDKATNILPVDDFLDLATRMVLVFGASFELPLVLVMLNLIGLLSARRMVGWWRTMVLGITAFSAIATPSTDPLSMLLLAVPITALYLLACAVSWCADRRRRARAAAEDTASHETPGVAPPPAPAAPARGRR